MFSVLVVLICGRKTVPCLSRRAFTDCAPWSQNLAGGKLDLTAVCRCVRNRLLRIVPPPLEEDVGEGARIRNSAASPARASEALTGANPGTWATSRLVSWFMAKQQGLYGLYDMTLP